MNRRNALVSLGLTPLVIPSLTRSCIAGQDSEVDTPAEEKMIDYLFVHTADGCTLTEGRLRLRRVAPATLFFSDRPERIVGHLPTDAFIEHWSVGGKESFEAEPPNAALTMQSAGHAQAAIVVVLRNPRRDDGDLVYDVTTLGDETTVTEGGVCSLFIDTYGMPLRSSSFGGTSRHLPHHTLPHDTLPHDTLPHKTLPHHSLPHHSLPHHSLPHHTLPHHRMARRHHW